MGVKGSGKKSSDWVSDRVEVRPELVALGLAFWISTAVITAITSM